MVQSDLARSSPASTRATPGSPAISSRARDAIVRPGDVDVGELDGRRRRSRGCRTCRASRRTGPAGRSDSPASRSTRFREIGRFTSTWPYSLTTQTRAPTARAASSSGAQASSSSRTSRAMSQPRRAEPLRVVVEVRQVDQRQVGPLAIAAPRRAQRAIHSRAGQPRARPPEGVERETARGALPAARRALRRAGDAEDLVAVGPIVAAWASR